MKIEKVCRKSYEKEDHLHMKIKKGRTFVF